MYSVQWCNMCGVYVYMYMYMHRPGLAFYGNGRQSQIIITTFQGVESLARFSPTQLSITDLSPLPWSGLRTLNLSFNKLGVACGRGLATLLHHCKGLQELSLTSCRLGPSTFDKDTGLCEALKGNERRLIHYGRGQPYISDICMHVCTYNHP